MLPTLSHDKALHFLYGALIFSATVVLFLLTFPYYAICIAGVAVISAAVGKELRDFWSNLQAKKKNLVPTHGVEAWDAIATIAGGVVVLVPLLCVKYLV